MEFPLAQLGAITLLQLGWGVLAVGGMGICWYLCEKAMKGNDDV